jgi:hypothetical protein
MRKEREVVFERVVFGIWQSSSKIPVFDLVVPIEYTRGDYLRSLASLDSGGSNEELT